MQRSEVGEMERPSQPLPDQGLEVQARLHWGWEELQLPATLAAAPAAWLPADRGQVAMLTGAPDRQETHRPGQ